MPTALITGITGQDGSYLTELLLEKGYEVHGIVRRSSNTVRQRLDHLTANPEIYNKYLFLHYADLDDTTTLRRIIFRIQPQELYHLAGQSHVGASFEIPESTCEFIAMGTLRLLEILRDMNPRPKFLHASSSEIFGNPKESPQNEETPMNPVTPYGVAKAFATSMVKLYREAHGFFASNAICYNHESPRRGESFVTRKISRGAARISLGLEHHLHLGNLDSVRDWGHAKEYVEAMWRLLQTPSPTDLLLATGTCTSVRSLLQIAFHKVGIDPNKYVTVDARYMRLFEPQVLFGNAQKAEQLLNWKPKYTAKDIIEEMVSFDLQQAIHDDPMAHRS